LLLRSFFRLSIRALVAKIWPDKVVRWCPEGDFLVCFLGSAFPASRVQHISDLHYTLCPRKNGLPEHVYKSSKLARFGQLQFNNMNICLFSTRRPAYADRTARHQFRATGQPVSRTQASDPMASRLPCYEAKCVQRRCFQCGSVPLRSDIKGTEPPPANILIPLKERQLIAI